MINPINEYIRVYAEENSLTAKESLILCSQLVKDAKKRERNNPDYIPKEYVGRAIGLSAYIKILDSNCSITEALQYAASLAGESSEWVEEVKHRDYYYTKETVNSANYHPKQKEMVKNKMFYKAELVGCSTINQQLTRLKKYKDSHDSAQLCKISNKELRDELNRMKIAQSSTNIDQDMLYYLLDIDKLPIKDRALKLKNIGYSNKEIAEHLKITIRTVQKWIKPK